MRECVREKERDMEEELEKGRKGKESSLFATARESLARTFREISQSDVKVPRTRNDGAFSVSLDESCERAFLRLCTVRSKWRLLNPCKGIPVNTQNVS